VNRIHCHIALFCLVATSSLAAEPPGTNYDESKVGDYTLPNPLVMLDGTSVKTADAWKSKRRPEILRLFEEHVYGKTPGGALPGMHAKLVESDAKALGGRATRKQITIFFTADEQGPQMDLLVYIPNAAKMPAPAFLGLNFQGNHTVHTDPAIRLYPRWLRADDKSGIVDNAATEKARGSKAYRWQVEKVIDRGYAIATANYGDLDPDNYKDDFSDGVHPLFYKPGQTRPDTKEWGAIGAWAWGLSRALDYIIENEKEIDGKKVAVLGLSRLGKTSLWAGAQDERFALVISDDSGCGGAALYRRNFGEQVHHMVEGPIGYWFCKNHYQYAHRENDLPVDQHMLIALMAPRPVYVASAEDDRWADPKGEFLAALNATSVYSLFNLEGLPASELPAVNRPVSGTIGYHVRTGEHDLLEYDWDQFLAFADKHLR
jgi:hypothetical protein